MQAEREAAAAEVVRDYWRLMDAGDFTGAGALLADDYICEWPQSRERIRGRERFVAVNAHYPGRWRITVERLVAAGDEAASDVRMVNEGGETARAVSFFSVREGKIVVERDYWPAPYPAPEWRARWVEQMDEVE